jgi:hypothetical protein
MSTGENSFVQHRSPAILPAEALSSKQEERAKGMMNLALRSILFTLASDFYMT